MYTPLRARFASYAREFEDAVAGESEREGGLPCQRVVLVPSESMSTSLPPASTALVPVRLRFCPAVTGVLGRGDNSLLLVCFSVLLSTEARYSGMGVRSLLLAATATLMLAAEMSLFPCLRTCGVGRGGGGLASQSSSSKYTPSSLSLLEQLSLSLSLSASASKGTCSPG